MTGVKAILAGADAVQIVSALLRHGPGHLDAMRQGLERWMDWYHFERLEEARGGVSLKRIADTGIVRARPGHPHATELAAVRRTIVNTVLTHAADQSAPSGVDDPFHDPVVIGIGIAFVVMAIAILVLTGLFTWGNLYGSPS